MTSNSIFYAAQNEPDVQAAKRALDVAKSEYDEEREAYHVACSTIAHTVVRHNLPPSLELRDIYSRTDARQAAAFKTYMDAYDVWTAARNAAIARIEAYEAAQTSAQVD